MTTRPRIPTTRMEAIIGGNLKAVNLKFEGQNRLFHSVFFFYGSANPPRADRSGLPRLNQANRPMALYCAG